MKYNAQAVTSSQSRAWISKRSGYVPEKSGANLREKAMPPKYNITLRINL